MNNSLAEEYPDIFTINIKFMKENDAVVKEPENKFIGSNSFQFWLKIDKIRKANNIVKKFKKNLIVKNYYELKDLIIKKK